MYSHDVNPSGSITFQDTNALGVYVPGIASVPLNIAIETTGGPWLNNGTGTSQYEVGLSDDNGVTWHQLWEYTGVQCYEQSGDANHVLIFMQAIAGRQYKVRVFDEDGNFVPNTGSMGIKVYTQTTDTMDQWTNCGDGFYGLKPIATSDANKLKTSDVLLDLIPFFFDATNPLATAVDGANALIDLALHVPGIPANNSSGVLLGGQILVGQDYTIQIYGGPWYPASGTDDPSFNVELSPDNGTSWYDTGSISTMPGVQCLLRVGPHNDEGYIRVYFTAQPGAMYRIRSDDGGTFLDNHGSMDYALFQVTQQDAILYTPGTVDQWAEACTTPPAPPDPPTAPSSAFDVTGWLSYLSGLVSNIPGWIVYSVAEIKYFFLWCPEHTAALMNIPTIFADREPFATVLSIMDTINKIKAEFEAMDWTNDFMPATIFTQGEGGGAQEEEPVNLLNPITDPNSPLNGGPLLTVPEGGGTTTISSAYLSHCEETVNPILGSLFGHNACLSFAYVRQNPQILYWIELVWEIFWIGFFIAWMINYYHRVKDLLTL
jgi:hypothetical protein